MLERIGPGRLATAFLFPSPPPPLPIFFNGCPPNLSPIINLLLHSFWVGEYSVMYCPSLRSGQYCHPRTEYSPVLPSQSCNKYRGLQLGVPLYVSFWWADKASRKFFFPPIWIHSSTTSRDAYNWKRLCPGQSSQAHGFFCISYGNSPLNMEYRGSTTWRTILYLPAI